jgi:hypothetical protein
MSAAARRPARLAGLLARMPAWVLAAGLALGYLVVAPPSADLAAQTYRVELFRQVGFTLWDNGWYSGHHLPGYSLLFPPLGALLGVRVAGALAAVGAAWAFERLTVDRFGPGPARVASLWFGLGTGGLLVAGRLTFALGVALAVGAAWAASSRRQRAAVGLGLLAGAASPVAGAFLALGAAAWGLGTGERGRAAALGLAALGPAVALGVLFPAGGTFPFVPAAFWPSLAATLVVLALIPAEQRVLRIGTALYAAALVASFAIPSPMGGNAVRLGAMLAGPTLALALLPRARRRLLLIAPALLWWQWVTPLDDWAQAAGDPTVQERSYAGLVAFLERQEGPPFRVEVPFTDNHWESAWLGSRVPLARGWQRQLDRRVNPLFYDSERPLTATRYRRWLDANAVRFVALPDAPLDYSARAEARLLRRGVSYLRPVYRDRVWRVWEVRDAEPLAASGELVELGPDHFTLDAGARGTSTRVRIRWTPYWQVASGIGCVGPTPDGFTRVDAVGRVEIRARFDPRRPQATSRRCSP